MLEVCEWGEGRRDGCFALVPVLARASVSLGEQSPMLVR